MNIRIAIIAIAFCLAVASIGAPQARASGAYITTAALDCTMNPFGLDTAQGCKSITPNFTFDAYFALGSAPPASFQAEWSITSNLGDAPLVGSGCTSTSSYCDLLLSTNASGPTKVTVGVNIYAMPAHTLVTTGQAVAIAPCTTIKPPNHPTSC